MPSDFDTVLPSFPAVNPSVLPASKHALASQ
jgi:hypothetical protein